MRSAILLLLLITLTAPALAQRGGTLISAEPVTTAPAGLRSWRIRYWTTDDRARPIAVTGMVVAPPGPVSAEPRDVIAWTHGTWGVARQCAPSLSSRFYELTPALDAVRAGYVVVAPDYPGLGSAMPHPYLVGAVTGRSVLHAVQAARTIRGAAAGPRFAVWGESQGGHAALWTGQLAGTDGAGLRLVGVAVGAPPTDLAANFREAGNVNARALLTAYTAHSWSRHYRLPLRIGRRTTPALIDRLAGNCVSSSSTPRLLGLLGILTLRRDLRGLDFPATPPWSTYVAANSATPRSSVPVLLAQTREDPLVAAAVTRRFGRALCASGTRVRWIDLPGGDHMNTAKQSAAATLAWIGDRFAGRRPPSDCQII